MEWDFTREDVESGKAGYSVLEFKEDLFEEIHANLKEFHGDEQTLQFFSNHNAFHLPGFWEVY